MTNYTAEQVRSKYLEGMGDQLGLEFYHCREQFLAVTFKWDVFETLFGQKERVDLLNETIGPLAAYIRNEFLNGVAMGVARLLDPPAHGRYQNLTLKKVCDACPENLRKTTNELFAIIQKEADELRKIRNKRLAHNDLEFATNRSGPAIFGTRENITKLLGNILKLLNLIDMHYLEQATSIIPLGNDSSMKLLTNLHYGRKVRPKIRDAARGRAVSLSDMLEVPNFLVLSEEEQRRYGA